MATIAPCPRCGRATGSRVLGGLCPACVRRVSLDFGEKASNESLAAEGLEKALPAAKTQFGDYELIELIASGGMGMIFRARQIKLNRTVALKLMQSGQFASPSELRRFKAEAEAAAQLQHPNIVPVYEVGEHEGRAFFSMELITGGTLAERLARPPSREPHAEPSAAATAPPRALDPRRAAHIMAKVAGGVHHAHLRGVLHRDLKPANILLDEQGEPHVADFGLAKILTRESAERLTLSGAVLGTPAYMAPEQASGHAHEMTTAADIYGLGAVLYHLLTGRAPFEGATHLETLRKLQETEPRPPSTLGGKTDQDLETICLKCLEKEPIRRYPTALALAEDLERWLRGEPIHARPATAHERLIKWACRRPAMTALAAVTMMSLLLGVAGIVWQWRRAEQLARAHQEQIVRLHTASGLRHLADGDLLSALPWFSEALRGEASGNAALESHRTRLATTLGQTPWLCQVWFHDGLVHDAQFSRDGRWVATACQDKTARVWDAWTGNPVTPPLLHDSPVRCVAFSPDGSLLATGCEDATAWLWPMSLGKPMGTKLVLTGRQMAIEPVNQIVFDLAGHSILATTRSHNVKRWDARTRSFLEWHSFGKGSLSVALAGPADGEFLAGSIEGSLFHWKPGSEEGEKVLELGAPIRVAVLSPARDRLLLGAENGQAQIWEIQKRRFVGEPISHTGAVRSAAFSPDGQRFATGGLDGIARLWHAATGQPVTPPLPHGAAVVSVAFSPDGRRLAAGGEDSVVRLWDASTGQAAGPPLLHGAQLRFVQFSPDGDKLLTVTDERVVRLWELLGRSRARIAVAASNVWHQASFFSDGQKLLIVRSGDKHLEWRTDLTRASNSSSGSLKLEFGFNMGRASLSPDGKKLAVPILEKATKPVRVFDTADGRSLAAFGPDQEEITFVAWRPDGRVLVTAGYDETAQLWNPDTGATLGAAMRHAGIVYWAEFSPDGRRIATASADRTARVWDAETGAPLTTPLSHANIVALARFSPDSRLLVTASMDNSARVWNAATGEPATPPLTHASWVTDAVFSADGRRVATVSDDNTARVWETASGRPSTPPMRMEADVTRPQFTSDGKRLLVHNETYARVWDALTGQALTPPLRGERMLAATWSADQATVVTATAHQGVLSFETSDGASTDADLLLAAELISSRIIDDTGALVPPMQTGRLTEEQAAANLRSAWEQLRARHAERFSPSRERTRAWHEQEALANAVRGDTFAAEFHRRLASPAEP